LNHQYHWSIKMRTQTIRIGVQGLSCAGCAGRAERALSRIAGLHDVTVNFANGEARMLVDGTDAAAIAEALKAANYPAREETVTLTLEGLTCATCVARAEAALMALPAVLDASVNLATQTARVRYLPGSTDTGTLARALADAGYPARPMDTQTGDQATRRAEEVSHSRRLVWIAGALTVPVFVLEMGSHVIPGLQELIHGRIGVQASWLVQFVLTTLVLVWPGRQFFRLGLPALMRGAPDMNSLVALGTSAAWLYSVVALFLPRLLPETARAVYFEAAAVIVTLILVGRWLEARAKGRTGAAIERLIGLQPASARIERGGAVQEVAIADIAPGDLIHVRPGERIAVDGEVTDGAGRPGGAGVCACRDRHRTRGRHPVAGLWSRAGAQPCACRGRFGPDHRLPLCHGAGDTHLDHGGHRARRRDRRALSQGRGAATA
jgi:Cu+-exporting ATPase